MDKMTTGQGENREQLSETETFRILVEHLQEESVPGLQWRRVDPAIEKTRVEIEAFCSNNAEGFVVTANQSAHIMAHGIIPTDNEKFLVDQRDLISLAELLQQPDLRNVSPEKYSEWNDLEDNVSFGV